MLFGSFCSTGFASGIAAQHSTRSRYFSVVRSRFGHQIISFVFTSASYTLDIFFLFVFLAITYSKTGEEDWKSEEKHYFVIIH